MVELITDYLEGALSRTQRRRFEATSPVRALRGVPRADARHDPAHGRLRSEDLTPEMEEEFTELYRRWRAEEESA